MVGARVVLVDVIEDVLMLTETLVDVAVEIYVSSNERIVEPVEAALIVAVVVVVLVRT